MKKLAAVVVTVLLTVPLFAAEPTMKGNFVVTLPLVNYWSGMGDLYKVGDDKESSWTIGIEDYEMGVQWFAVNNFAVGGSIAYDVEKTGSTSTSKVFSIMPEVSYYMPMDKMIPFASVAYVYMKESVNSVKYMQLPVKVGVSYMTGNNLAPYISLAYTVIDSVKMSSEVKGNKLTVEAGVKAFF